MFRCPLTHSGQAISTQQSRNKRRYDPNKHACWRSGPVPYEHVAATFAALDTTTKRLRIGDALTNMFVAVMTLHPDDLEATAYLTVGKIAPEYEGREMQVGGSTVSSAISDATGVRLTLACAALHTHCVCIVATWLVALVRANVTCITHDNSCDTFAYETVMPDIRSTSAPLHARCNTARTEGARVQA